MRDQLTHVFFLQSVCHNPPFSSTRCSPSNIHKHPLSQPCRLSHGSHRYHSKKSETCDLSLDKASRVLALCASWEATSTSVPVDSPALEMHIMLVPHCGFRPSKQFEELTGLSTEASIFVSPRYCSESDYVFPGGSRGSHQWIATDLSFDQCMDSDT